MMKFEYEKNKKQKVNEKQNKNPPKQSKKKAEPRIFIVKIKGEEKESFETEKEWMNKKKTNRVLFGWLCLKEKDKALSFSINIKFVIKKRKKLGC